MSVARAGAIVWVAAAVTIAVGLVLGNPADWQQVMALLFLGIGLGQAVVASLLAARVLAPTAPGWGASPAGQVLLAAASSCFAVVLWGHSSLPTAVGITLCVSFLLLNIVGFRMERRAHERHSPL